MLLLHKLKYELCYIIVVLIIFLNFLSACCCEEIGKQQEKFTSEYREHIVFNKSFCYPPALSVTSTDKIFDNDAVIFTLKIHFTKVKTMTNTYQDVYKRQ